SARLPDYMIPSRFIILADLPLNANGKLDKKALTALLVHSDEASSAQDEAAKGPQEQLLAEIWQTLLNVERVGRHDNFFELGGDSILALQVVARARKQGM
ncbi:hypothetical protein J3L16_16075, partial [Alteromonas sp. 5E99-2]|uniref:phosphopantetheine-binding protein n=1 Tax=Alteromonas sp. 5E99-2 TaxID=2817683 RepID=UPI001A9858BA